MPPGHERWPIAAALTYGPNSRLVTTHDESRTCTSSSWRPKDCDGASATRWLIDLDEAARLITGHDIVCISSIDWDYVWQGHQEIMTRLAQQGNRVLFIENT